MMKNKFVKFFTSQRKNRIRPSTSCNVSAVINAMSEASISINFKNGRERPADILMQYIDTTKWWKRLQQIHKGSTANPWNYSQILCEAVNELQGEKIARWKSFKIEEMKNGLSNNTYVVGGTFARLRHFVVVHGYSASEKLFYVDDSWGNPLTQYEDHNGDDIRLPFQYLKNSAFYDRAWKRGRAPVIEFGRK